MRTTFKDFFFARIFPWPFALVGALIFYYGMIEILDARASLGWPHTSAKIISSEVEIRRSGGSRRSTTYHAAVLYEYQVNSVAYKGNNVYYGMPSSSWTAPAQRIVNRYPKGKDVQVYYNPAKPEECVLEPGVAAATLIFPGVGLIFLGAGVLMLIAIPRSMAKSRSAIEQESVGQSCPTKPL